MSIPAYYKNCPCKIVAFVPDILSRGIKAVIMFDGGFYDVFLYELKSYEV